MKTESLSLFRINEILSRKKLFDQKFERKSDDECWQWKAAKNVEGNGIFRMGGLWNNATKPAHVAAWFFYEDHHFDFNAKIIFHHLCGSKGCVNPSHLVLLSQDGIHNEEGVLSFIARRNPEVSSVLLDAAKRLQESKRKGPDLSSSPSQTEDL